MARKKKIVLAGYYGYGNAGDELIRENILKSFSEHLPDIEITVLQRHPSKRADTKEINRYNFFSISAELFSADVLLLGGGSLLQDRSGIFTVYYYLFLIFLGKIYNAKTVLFNQGIGPITNSFNYFISGLILSFADLIIVRNRESLLYLRSMLFFKKEIYLGADPVFYRQGSINKKEIKKKKVGLSIRNWKKYPIKDRVNQTAKLLKEKYEFCNIKFNRKKDSLNNKEIIEHEWEKTDDIWGMMSDLNIFVGMRLHSLMCAAISGLPMVGIVYDPKVKSFSKFMEIPHLELSEATPKKIKDMIEKNIDLKVDYSKKIQKLRERYTGSIEIFKSIFS